MVVGVRIFLGRVPHQAMRPVLLQYWLAAAAATSTAWSNVHLDQGRHGLNTSSKIQYSIDTFFFLVLRYFFSACRVRKKMRISMLRVFICELHINIYRRRNIHKCTYTHAQKNNMKLCAPCDACACVLQAHFVIYYGYARTFRKNALYSTLWLWGLVVCEYA